VNRSRDYRSLLPGFLRRGFPLLLLCLVSASCGALLPEVPLTVRMPDLPESWESWAGGITFRLIFPSPEGGLEEIPGLEPGSLTTVRHRPGEKFPVLASPEPGALLPSAGGFRPAGGIFPLDCEPGGLLTLRWREGFLADCLMRIWENTGTLEWIHLERLREAVLREAPEDPWYLDGRRLIRPLIFGRFYGGFVAPGEVREVFLPAELTGWSWGDPLMEPPAGDSPARLYPGVHRLTRPDGGARADLQVDGRGWILRILPGDLQTEGFW